jgi:hypothetical protein
MGVSASLTIGGTLAITELDPEQHSSFQLRTMHLDALMSSPTDDWEITCPNSVLMRLCKLAISFVNRFLT